MAGNISEFDAGNLRLQPSQSGVEADVRAAYRGGALFNRAAMETERAYDTAGRAIGGGIAAAGAAAVQFEDHREISAGAKDGAQLLLNQETQWNNLIKTSDPNDPSVAAKFRDQQLEPALNDFLGQFHTEKSQEWATHFVGQVREHMFSKTAADESTLAGIAIHENARKTANTFAQTVYNDPSSLGMALNGFNHSLEGLTGSSPTLSPAKAAEIKETFGYDATKQLVSAAIHGAIAKGGDWRSIAENPAYAKYVNGPEIEQFVRAQRTQDHINLAYQKQAEVMQKQLDTMNVEKAANAVMNDHVTIDPSGHAVIAPQFFKDALDIARKYPNAPNAAATVRTMVDWGESQDKKFYTDPSVLNDLVQRASDPSNPTTEMQLLRAEADGKVSHSDAAPVREMIKSLQQDPIKNPVWPATQQAVKDYFLSHATKDDPLGSSAFAHFVQVFLPEYQRENREGKLQPNALDMHDPNSLIRRSMTPFNSSLTETMKRLGSGQSAFTPPAGWQFSRSRNQYRDPSGKLYNMNGEAVNAGR